MFLVLRKLRVMWSKKISNFCININFVKLNDFYNYLCSNKRMKMVPQLGWNEMTMFNYQKIKKEKKRKKRNEDVLFRLKPSLPLSMRLEPCKLEKQETELQESGNGHSQNYIGSDPFYSMWGPFLRCCLVTATLHSLNNQYSIFY